MKYPSPRQRVQVLDVPRHGRLNVLPVGTDIATRKGCGVGVEIVGQDPTFGFQCVPTRDVPENRSMTERASSSASIASQILGSRVRFDPR